MNTKPHSTTEPWRIVQVHGTFEIWTRQDDTPGNRNNYVVCSEIQNADEAKRILRACNRDHAFEQLLVACKSMLNWMEFTIPNLDRYKVPDRMNWGGPISKARNAIAQAEGKPLPEYRPDGIAI